MSKTWMQAVGTFNRANINGEFVAVQPAGEANMPAQRAESQLILLIEGEYGRRMADIPVVVDFGSCDEEIDEGTFQVFFELPENVALLRLLYKGQELAVYSASKEGSAAVETFGLGPRRGQSVPLTQASDTDPNASYTLQAREKGSTVWQTLDIGMERPDVGNVDLNQFPAADAVEVRVLKSSGFQSEEIDRTQIDFNE